MGNRIRPFPLPGTQNHHRFIASRHEGTDRSHFGFLLFKLLHPGVRNVSARHAKVGQPLDCRKFHQPGIRNLGHGEIQDREVLEGRKLLDSVIRQTRATKKVEDAEVPEGRQILHLGVRHPRPREVEGDEVLEGR